MAVDDLRVTKYDDDLDVVLDVAFAANGEDGQGVLPGGLAGQTLKKLTDADFDTFWDDPAEGVPTDGDTGQVLTKLSALPLDTAWVDVPPGVPVGGAAGAVLTKLSSADYNMVWAAPASPAGYAQLAVANTFTAVNTFNAGIVLPTAPITLGTASPDGLTKLQYQEGYFAVTNPQWGGTLRVYGPGVSDAATATNCQLMTLEHDTVENFFITAYALGTATVPYIWLQNWNFGDNDTFPHLVTWEDNQQDIGTLTAAPYRGRIRNIYAATGIYEAGVALASKYARLAAANTFTATNTFSATAALKLTGADANIMWAPTGGTDGEMVLAYEDGWLSIVNEVWGAGIYFYGPNANSGSASGQYAAISLDETFFAIGADSWGGAAAPEFVFQQWSFGTFTASHIIPYHDNVYDIGIATPITDYGRPRNVYIAGSYYEAGTALSAKYAGLAAAGNIFTGGPITLNRSAVASSADIFFNVATVQTSYVNFQQAGVMRWRMGKGSSAEGGSGVTSTGSNFNLQAYDNAGTLVGTAFTVVRGSMVVDFAVTPTVAGVPIGGGGGGQPLDATLTALAALNATAGFVEQTGADTFTKFAVTTFGKSLIDDADAAAGLVTLGAAPLASPTFTGVVTFADGTAALPSIKFAADADTGFFSVAGNVMISTNGVERYRFGSGGQLSIAANIALGSSVAPTGFLFTDGANTLAQRNGVNAQTFSVYNTWTSASVYERLAITWATNVATITTQHLGATMRNLSIFAGTGAQFNFGGGGAAQWSVTSAGHLIVTDNTYDIGASGATRPRNVYVAGTVAAAALSEGGVLLSAKYELIGGGGGGGVSLSVPNTWTALQSFTTTSGLGLEVISTDPGAGVGPIISFKRNSVSPAVDDVLGGIWFQGNDSTPTMQVYSAITSKVIDTTPASFDAKLQLQAAVGSSVKNILTLGPGAAVGNAADMGEFTLNAGTLYENAVSLSAKYAQFGVANTFTLGQTINMGDTLPSNCMTLISTWGSASAGPFLTLSRLSPDPAALDELGQISFVGKDSGLVDTTYASIGALIVDPTNGSEDSKLRIRTIVGSTTTTIATFEAGVLVGTSTGGDKGTNTLNANTLYEAGTALSAKYLLQTSYTAADVLAKLLTVDGAGSGIDADLLDGQSSAAFVSASAITKITDTVAAAKVVSAAVAPNHFRVAGYTTAGDGGEGVWNQEADDAGIPTLLKFQIGSNFYINRSVKVRPEEAGAIASGLIADGAANVAAFNALLESVEHDWIEIPRSGIYKFNGVLSRTAALAMRKGLIIEMHPDAELDFSGVTSTGSMITIAGQEIATTAITGADAILGSHEVTLASNSGFLVDRMMRLKSAKLFDPNEPSSQGNISELNVVDTSSGTTITMFEPLDDNYNSDTPQAIAISQIGRLRIIGGKIRGNSAIVQGGISLRYAQNPIIEGTHFIDFQGESIIVRDCLGGKVDAIDVYGHSVSSSGYGVSVQDSTRGFTVTKSNFRRCRHAVTMTNAYTPNGGVARDITVSENYVYGTAEDFDDAMDTHNCALRVRFLNNRIVDSKGNGIHTECPEVEIVGNTIHRCRTTGCSGIVSVNGSGRSSYQRISDNYIYDCSNSGIYVGTANQVGTDIDRCIIENNNIYQTDGTGSDAAIHVADGGKHISIKNNYIEDYAIGAIRILDFPQYVDLEGNATFTPVGNITAAYLEAFNVRITNEMYHMGVAHASKQAIYVDTSAADVRVSNSKFVCSGTAAGTGVVAGAGATDVYVNDDVKFTGFSTSTSGPVIVESREVLGELAGVNTQTASYTLALTDKGKAVEINNASANNLTVPLNSAVAFPIGTRIDISQLGAGQTTIVPTGGVTIRQREAKLKLAGQYAGASLYKRGTNEWVLFGDVSA